MITCQRLANVCAQIVEIFENETATRADCIAIMYEPDPASPMVLVFPLPLADVMAKQGKPRLRSILNPAEHADEFELSIPEDIEAELPRGDDLQRLVRDTVDQMRRDMPDRLIYMTDPECSELVDSVREAQLPPGLAWLSSYL